MGLDVYLKKCPDLAAAKAREALMSEFEDALWEEVGGWNGATEEQKELIRAKTKVRQAELKLGEYGEADEIEAIEINSTLHPDHMFKIGYLRSSYNSGGINSVLERNDCPSLYDIFEPTDEYNFTPDWVQAQARCQVALDTLKTRMGSEMAKYDVTTITNMMGTGAVGTAAEALKVFEEQLKRKKDTQTGFNSYGCREGDFYLDGITVCGIIPNSGFGGGVHLITRNDSKEDNLSFYYQALEVTKEMIDYVLAQDDSNTYYLSWSG
jgi:hypothetical protein